MSEETQDIFSNSNGNTGDDEILFFRRTKKQNGEYVCSRQQLIEQKDAEIDENVLPDVANQTVPKEPSKKAIVSFFKKNEQFLTPNINNQQSASTSFTPIRTSSNQNRPAPNPNIFNIASKVAQTPTQELLNENVLKLIQQQLSPGQQQQTLNRHMNTKIHSNISNHHWNRASLNIPPSFQRNTYYNEPMPINIKRELLDKPATAVNKPPVFVKGDTILIDSDSDYDSDATLKFSDNEDNKSRESTPDFDPKLNHEISKNPPTSIISEQRKTEISNSNTLNFSQKMTEKNTTTTKRNNQPCPQKFISPNLKLNTVNKSVLVKNENKSQEQEIRANNKPISTPQTNDSSGSKEKKIEEKNKPNTSSSQNIHKTQPSNDSSIKSGSENSKIGKPGTSAGSVNSFIAAGHNSLKKNNFSKKGKPQTEKASTTALHESSKHSKKSGTEAVNSSVSGDHNSLNQIKHAKKHETQSVKSYGKDHHSSGQSKHSEKNETHRKRSKSREPSHSSNKSSSDKHHQSQKKSSEHSNNKNYGLHKNGSTSITSKNIRPKMATKESKNSHSTTKSHQSTEKKKSSFESGSHHASTSKTSEREKTRDKSGERKKSSSSDLNKHKQTEKKHLKDGQHNSHAQKPTNQVSTEKKTEKPESTLKNFVIPKINSNNADTAKASTSATSIKHTPIISSSKTVVNESSSSSKLINSSETRSDNAEQVANKTATSAAVSSNPKGKENLTSKATENVPNSGDSTNATSKQNTQTNGKTIASTSTNKGESHSNSNLNRNIYVYQLIFNVI